MISSFTDTGASASKQNVSPVTLCTKHDIVGESESDRFSNVKDHNGEPAVNGVSGNSNGNENKAINVDLALGFAFEKS